MRRLSLCHCSLLILAWLFVLPRMAQADPPDPSCCRAHVVTAGAAVRSGPGENYYLTDTLAEGATVEVYQRRPDGWCAIRPPANSFSWVFARHVEAVGDGLGRINKEDVPARVGSNLSGERTETQVLLREGEIVSVIDEETHDGQTWYKIAPPAGEFRWIRESDIQNELDSNADAAKAGPAWRSMEQANQQSNAPAGVSADAGVSLASTTLAASAAPVQASTAGAATLAAASPDNAQPDAALPEEFGRKVADLEMQLSRMVAEPTDTWNVEQIDQNAEQLLSQAQSVAERDAVHGLLTKIDRFAAIQRRYAQANGNAVPATPAATTPIATPQQSLTAASVTPQPDAGGQFDAVGVLRPVVSRRPGAPQFALVDQRGQVVSFVTPSPDLNLQPYLGHRVGVVGTRGFIPEFNRAHVTAGRVSPLDQNLLR
jgi:uncharacterized protein YgiM (DUF1202 family)